MNTSQNFFYNIVNSHAETYSQLNNIIGDFNKNTGLAANFYELATNILGNTVSDNSDLSLIFPSSARSQFLSDNSDTLNQSLRNSYIGIAYSNFSSYPTDVCTHISTSLFSYNSSISSTFLSGQIYSFSTSGIGTNSNIILPISYINFSGAMNNSWLLDAPLDFAIYGLDRFNGSYSGSKLISFNYSWSYYNNQTNLIINLGFTTNAVNKYYLITYWGNASASFINTSSTIVNNIVYLGTNNFINNIALSTQNLIIPSNFQSYTTRKNFWNTKYPYSVNFINNSFIDSTTYLYTPGRLNFTFVDGISQGYQDSNIFGINGAYIFSGLNTNFCYLYLDSATSGGVSANINLGSSYSSNFSQSVNVQSLKDSNTNNVPLVNLSLQFSPNKSGSNIPPYTVTSFNQIVPSAFTKNISDSSLWTYFSKPLMAGKNSYSIYSGIEKSFLSTLDNFFAAYLFGYQYTDVSTFFSGSSLYTSQFALKLFTQPYSFYKTPALNFNQKQEKTLYGATNIVSSKEFIKFEEGKLTINLPENLPADGPFEIFKPISFVCNGIDPFNQGTGFALDYTLNIKLTYANQNILQKTLYLMASKHLLTENDYYTRYAANQDVTGYYYLVDAQNPQVNTNDYSVSSIREFYLYGYSGLIPDLKDGDVRPILTRQFSPEDGTKYTYDQFIALLKAKNPNITSDQINDAVQNFLDSGGQFYSIDTNSFSSNFNNIEELSLCATNYINAFQQSKYWNDQFNNFAKIGYGAGEDNYGFLTFQANNISGSLTGSGTVQINNVSVGNNCVVKSLSVTSIGSSQVAGTYQEYVLPVNISSGQFPAEQPAVIKYTILSSGVISSDRVTLVSPGSNFYYDFNYSVQCPLNIGGTAAVIRVKLDNTFSMSANTSSNNLISLTQTSNPTYGYNAGFYLNPNTFKELGYTPNGVSAQILISDSPTIDSFLISQSGQQVGVLENFTNFNFNYSDFSAINFTTGQNVFYLYDQEIINAINVPSSLQGATISNVSLQCKLINLQNYVPSGYFQAIIYKTDINNQPDLGNVAAISENIDITNLSTDSFQQVNVPLTFKFYDVNKLNYSDRYDTNKNLTIYLSIKQNINGAFLAIKGQFTGISSSSFRFSTSQISNSNSDIIVYGAQGVGTGSDLDLSYPIRFDLSYGVNTQINSTNVYLRKDYTVTDTSNALTLSVVTPATTYVSNTVNFNSLSNTFTGIAFTFNNLISTSQIIYSSFNFNSKIQEQQVYAARDLTQYNYSNGIGTTSIISIFGNLINFDFTFNKIFTSISNEILGAFNYTDNSQFGLAKPNLTRKIEPINIVDGYWAFKGKLINAPISIYPRAYLSYSSVIGTSSPSYVYLGYSHDIYVAVGYDRLGVSSIETLRLSARPSWKTTWMTRDLTNYKNFSISDVFIQSYFDSINYINGTASTLIGSYGTPKNAIFEGTFNPGQTNNQLPLFVTIGTSSGVQVYLNNSSDPVINTFTVVSSASTTLSYSISTTVRQSSISFKILYFTLSTAAISVGWNTSFPSGVSTLINSSSSQTVLNTPYNLNSGNPIDNLIFLNVSKSDTQDQVNFGFPTGDSFIIRSS